MTITPESIQVGKCYLADRREDPQIRQVIQIFPDGRLEYRRRPLNPGLRQQWRSEMTSVQLFPSSVTREVPCDWTPEREG